jgi:hypothetical protein
LLLTKYANTTVIIIIVPLVLSPLCQLFLVRLDVLIIVPLILSPLCQLFLVRLDVLTIDDIKVIV